MRAYIGAVARAVMDEADALGAGAGTGEEPVRLLGPTSCVIERAKDQYRHHFIIKSAPGLDISGALFRAVERVGAKPGVKLSVDVDAYDLM